MAGALATALAAPAATALPIFAARGHGRAVANGNQSQAPGGAPLLPRPGAWMQVLRELLAFPMYGAAIWLLWVASQELGSPGVLLVAGGMGLLGFGAWLLGRAQRAVGWSRQAGHAVALIVALSVLALLPNLGPAKPGPTETAPNDGSEPFSDARLAALRSAGRPVFVDMTAAWCVTCIVNELVCAPMSCARSRSGNSASQLAPGLLGAQICELSPHLSSEYLFHTTSLDRADSANYMGAKSMGAHGREER
jgi:thiol:disulfide interchange protein DsbD